MSRLTVLVLAALLAACSGLSNATTQPQSAAPTAPPSNTAASPGTPTPTNSPTLEASPVIPSSAPEADVVIVKTFLRSWVDIIKTPHAQIVVEVRNQGSGWADLRSGNSDYTVYAKDGSVTSTGSFLYVYPRYLAAGATSYFADETIGEPGEKASEFFKAEPTVQFEKIDQPGNEITAARIKLKRETYSGEITATGTVTNKGADTADRVVVGVFYLDGPGSVLGYSYTNLVENLLPGQTKGFSTVSGPPLRLSAIKKAVGFASDYGF